MKHIAIGLPATDWVTATGESSDIESIKATAEEWEPRNKGDFDALEQEAGLLLARNRSNFVSQARRFASASDNNNNNNNY